MARFGEVVEKLVDTIDTVLDNILTKVTRTITQSNATGAAAIALAVNPAAAFKLVSMSLHLSAAPTTSQSLTVTLDSGKGAAYDTVLYSRDLSVGSVTDLYVEFGDNYVYASDDHIDVAYTNTDTRTYGIIVRTEAV